MSSKKYKKTTKKKKTLQTDQKYNSGNGFLTQIWGPMLWSVLHMISFNYPVKPTKQEQNEYYVFVTSLQHVLPCGACRKNLTTNIKNIGLIKKRDFKNRESFSRWMYSLHNEVNKMLGKSTDQSYSEVRDMFEMFRAKCGKPKKGIEKGCILPINQVKTKCVLSIVPQSVKGKSLQIDNRCYPKKTSLKQLRTIRRTKSKLKTTRLTNVTQEDSNSSFESSYSD